MKEGVLDILIYLFENYFDTDLDEDLEPDRDTLKQELEHAGFPPEEVERALCWLEELAADPARVAPVPTARAIRIFDTLEQTRLDTDCRGYLVHLEHVGILSPTQRELVIDRLVALGPGTVGVLRADEVIECVEHRLMDLLILKIQGAVNAYEHPQDGLRGVVVEVLQDRECTVMMKEFIDQHPELWNEDIGQ